jgi:parallel beta-helix repeat protein
MQRLNFVLLFLSFPALATTWIVHPGESIQGAVDQASPGDTISILPGTYQEVGRTCPSDYTQRCAVVISTDDLQIIGASSPGHPVVLENAGGQDQGIAVGVVNAPGRTCLQVPSQRIQGSLIEGLTVNGFDSDGIFLWCVDQFTIRNCQTHDNREYGLFPSHSGFGSVIGNSATGSNDTGIYVGESHDVRVSHNVAHGNVSGFEIENSARVELDHNLAVGNTAGILSFTLPFLDVNTNEDNTIHNNTVLVNNKDNTCPSPESDVCLVPIGTGILLIAVQRNEVRNNLALGNNSLGIALADFCTANQIPPDVCSDLGIDPIPNGNRIEENIALGNGQDPDLQRLPPDIPGADVLWTGLGDNNCWSRNISQIDVSPIPFPSCE